MSDELVPFRLSPALGLMPPPRRPSWGQPEGDEPIIDAARISLRAFGTGRSPLRTLGMFIWLHAIRPALTLAIWFVAIWYIWPYVLSARWQPSVVHLLGFYALIICVIGAFMLMMAPLRSRQRQRETVPDQEASSLLALASYIDVLPPVLTAWQLTRQLLVRHDRHGHFEDATDSSLGVLEVGPGRVLSSSSA